MRFLAYVLSPVRWALPVQRTGAVGRSFQSDITLAGSAIVFRGPAVAFFSRSAFGVGLVVFATVSFPHGCEGGKIYLRSGPV